jgi:uncharacterized membrane protein YbaN (DUF454 family)
MLAIIFIYCTPLIYILPPLKKTNPFFFVALNKFNRKFINKKFRAETFIQKVFDNVIHVGFQLKMF